MMLYELFSSRESRNMVNKEAKGYRNICNYLEASLVAVVVQNEYIRALYACTQKSIYILMIAVRCLVDTVQKDIKGD